MGPQRRSSLAVAIAVAVISGGCAPRFVPPEAAARYYIASFELQHERAAVEIGGGQVLNERVHEDMKAKSLTIAFYPPENCLNTRAGPSGSAQQAEVLGLRCGVLMTEMETKAAQAGYAVVSWQLLKDASVPLQQARDLDVDLLFEVNELAVNERNEGESLTTAINFFEQAGTAPRTALEVADARVVGQRCDASVGQSFKGNARDFATLSVKLVSVQDGRALWFYQRSMGDVENEAQTSYDAYYESKPRIVKPRLPNFEAAARLLFLGAVSSLTASALPMSERFAGDGGSVQLERALQIGGGTLIVAGVGVVTAMNYSSRPTLKYPLADDILCVGAHSAGPKIGPIEPPSESVSAESTAGTGYQSTRVKTGDRDARSERQSELIKRLVLDFLTELERL